MPVYVIAASQSNNHNNRTLPHWKIWRNRNPFKAPINIIIVDTNTNNWRKHANRRLRGHQRFAESPAHNIDRCSWTGWIETDGRYSNQHQYPALVSWIPNIQNSIFKRNCKPSLLSFTVGEVANALNLNDEKFKTKYGRAKPSIESEIIFTCRSGKRAGTAGVVAAGLGYQK